MKRLCVPTLAAMLTTGLHASPRASHSEDSEGQTQTPQAPQNVVQAPRPYRPVFSGAAPDSSAHHVFDLSASVAGAYDDNVLAEGGGTIAPGAYQRSGFYSELSAQAAYSRRGERFDFQAGAGTNLRYYGEQREIVGTNHVADVGIAGRVGHRGRFNVNQSLSTAPSYLQRLLGPAAGQAPGLLATAADDYAVNDTSAYTYTTAAGFNQAIKRRGTLSLTSNLRRTDFAVNEAGLRDLTAYDLGGHVGYGLTRGATLRVGYVFRRGQYGDAQQHTEHTVDAGIDYVKPLSATRRTTFAMTTGSTMLNAPVQSGALGSAARQQYRIVADLSVTHQMSRTWTAAGRYHRGVELIEGLSGPVLSDAFNVSTEGFLGRRVDVRGSAAYSSGDGALPGSPTQFSTYTGQGRVRFGLSRHWAVYTEYLYYLYQFDRALQLPVGVPPQLERSGIRAGVLFMLPLRRR